jgi:hypothetical protein
MAGISGRVPIDPRSPAFHASGSQERAPITLI